MCLRRRRPVLLTGRIDFLSSLVNGETIAADRFERAQRIATERLADVAGVRDAQAGEK
jgi:hypothetical protein